MHTQSSYLKFLTYVLLALVAIGIFWVVLQIWIDASNCAGQESPVIPEGCLSIPYYVIFVSGEFWLFVFGLVSISAGLLMRFVLFYSNAIKKPA